MANALYLQMQQQNMLVRITIVSPRHIKYEWVCHAALLCHSNCRAVTGPDMQKSLLLLELKAKKQKRCIK